MNNHDNPSLVFENTEINKKNPWGDDALRRRDFARALTNTVRNTASPLTISVNGKWGTGKTFLLRRWRQELESGGYNAIYFNAWADDFCANPLVSIIGKLFGKVKFPKKAEILKITKILAVKYILSKMHLTKEDLESHHETIIADYAKESGMIDVLRQKLTDGLKGSAKPVIFIIDELDRCRPTYAIELLERVKHVFNVPGVFFVLGMNRVELAKSVKHVYGDIDADDYLRRFYEIEISLSEPKSSDYYLHLWKTHENHFSGLPRAFHDFGRQGTLLPSLLDCMEMSLRDVEHGWRLLRGALYNGAHGNTDAQILPVLIILKIKNPDLYARFFNRQCGCMEVVEYMLPFLANARGGNKNMEIVVKKCIFSAADMSEKNEIREELRIHSLSDGHTQRERKTFKYTTEEDKRRGLSLDGPAVNVKNILSWLDMVGY